MDALTTPIIDTNSQIDAILADSTGKPEYKTLRLDEYQIAQWWPVLAQTIAASVPPPWDSSGYVTPRVFQELQAGRMQAWIMVADREPKPEVCMIATTRWGQDAVTGEKHLVLFSLYGYEPVGGAVLEDAFQTLARFARGGGASRILAYTCNPRVVDLAERTGADTAWRFLHWRV